LIGRVNGQGQFDIIGSAPERVKADPYVVSHSLPQWMPDARSDLERAGERR
jgi:branched-chain amino acid transport system substrate-binding protein